MHIRSPPPPLFSAKRIGAPYGLLLLGTMRPLSDNYWTCLCNSSNFKELNGYNLRRVGGWPGSINGMVSDVQCLVIGYYGSANTSGKLASNSDNNSFYPSNSYSCAYPPCADRWVKCRSPTCSTKARYITSLCVLRANFAADRSSHFRCVSTMTAPYLVRLGHKSAIGFAHTPSTFHQLPQQAHSCIPCAGTYCSNATSLHFGHARAASLHFYIRAIPAALTYSTAVCDVDNDLT